MANYCNSDYSSVDGGGPMNPSYIQDTNGWWSVMATEDTASKRMGNSTMKESIRKRRVYISGPYTMGMGITENVREAIKWGDKLTQHGYVVFIPHLTHFWDLLHPHDYNFWLDQDLEWVRACDVVFKLPGESKGGDLECHRAKELGIPVESDLLSLILKYPPGIPYYEDSQSQTE